MIVYRLTKNQFKNDLSGRGAELAGGRWNSVGVPVLYTTESRALCTLEIAVHTPLNVVPAGYVMVAIQLTKKTDIKEIHIKDLPANWRSFPETRHTQILGDSYFKEGKYLAIKVPSAIVHGDHNILLNPLHTDFKTVKILSSEPFEFDQRLFLKPAQA